VLLRERKSAPSRIDILGIRLLPTWRSNYPSVDYPTALCVADAVKWGNLRLEKSGSFLENTFGHFYRGVPEFGKGSEGLKSSDVLEDEHHVLQGSSVVSHAPILANGVP
jgi:hypothetical protein